VGGEMAIHSTAIVSPKAELDASVEVGPYAIIEEHVKIGRGTRVGPHAFITGHTEIGRDNEIHIGAVLGHEPQDVKFDKNCRSFLRIGDRNIFREYCTVHRGTEPESATVIGNDCLLMGLSHVGHNCRVGNNAILCNCALVAGYVEIGERAFVSGGVVIHQFTRIGKLVMLSGNARIGMDVPPFMIGAERNELGGLNVVGLKRAKISEKSVKELKEIYKILFRSGLNVSQGLAKIAENGLKTDEGRELVAFIQSSKNGICMPPRD
jgi:UDP-N-acetylglucosamine acyltransferase